MFADPTKKELLKSLVAGFGQATIREGIFDAEEAIYWLASDFHGGQWSNLYSVLSTSKFRPGRCSNGPDPDSIAEEFYHHLVSEFFPEA